MRAAPSPVLDRELISTSGVDAIDFAALDVDAGRRQIAAWVREIHVFAVVECETKARILEEMPSTAAARAMWRAIDGERLTRLRELLNDCGLTRYGALNAPVEESRHAPTLRAHAAMLRDQAEAIVARSGFGHSYLPVDDELRRPAEELGRAYVAMRRAYLAARSAWTTARVRHATEIASRLGITNPARVVAAEAEERAARERMEATETLFRAVRPLPAEED